MTTRSLKNVRFALDGIDGTRWSLLDSMSAGTWPRLQHADDGRLSVREVCRRFHGPGEELRLIDGTSVTAWQQIGRDRVIGELRRRIRNAGIMRQHQTDFCGPYALLMEFARRRPRLYVRAIGDLLLQGVFNKPGGGSFVAAADLRGRPVPDNVAAADWIFAATLRDCENVTDDVDDGEGIEGITWPYELEEWIEDVLELKADYHPCWFDGEMSALRKGQDAVDAGGVAYLLVDSAIVNRKHPEDDEEDVWLRLREFAGGGLGSWSGRIHCEDDDMLYPNHYIMLFGDLRNTGSETDFNVDVWSFAHHYEITGSGDGFGEYLYAVITGVPR